MIGIRSKYHYLGCNTLHDFFCFATSYYPHKQGVRKHPNYTFRILPTIVIDRVSFEDTEEIPTLFPEMWNVEISISIFFWTVGVVVAHKGKYKE